MLLPAWRGCKTCGLLACLCGRESKFFKLFICWGKKEHLKRNEVVGRHCHTNGGKKGNDLYNKIKKLCQKSFVLFVQSIEVL
jgi:hypothetical protein